MMIIGIDLAREPDRTAWAVRTAGETNWHFHYDAEEFERAHGFSPFVRMESRAELEAFEFRTPAHEERVETALQDRLRAHADRQGPCVTAEYATSPLAGIRAFLQGDGLVDYPEFAFRRWNGSRWEHFLWHDVMLHPPLPSERLANRMGLGPRKYDGPCGLHPNLRAVPIGRAGWILENHAA